MTTTSKSAPHPAPAWWAWFRLARRPLPEAATGALFTDPLAPYFAAFARDDKETYKLI